MRKHWITRIASVLFIILLALAVVPAIPVSAAIITSTASGGAWSIPGTWVGLTVPGAGDSVVIASGATVILDAAITVDGSLTIQSGATLDTDAVNNYALIVNSNFSNSGTFKARASSVTISGAYAMDAGAFNGATSTLNLNGTVTQTGGTFTAGTTVNYGRGGNQTIISTTYTNLTTSGGSGTKTIGGAVTVNGTLTVGAGTIFEVITFAFAETDTTIVNGTLTHSSVAGTKNYADVTINGSGIWNDNAAAIGISFSGNLHNDGTLNAGTGTHTFTGTGGIFSGTNPISIPTITITGNHTNNGTLIVNTTLTVTGAGVTLTNNGTLTVGTTLTGTGGLTQGPGATLNISGNTTTITTLTASANDNTVNYNRTGNQSAGVTTEYYHLILGGSGSKTLTNVTTINGDLSLSTTTPGTTTTTATIAANFTIGGNLNVGDGTTLTVGGINMAVTGDTIVNGTLTHNNATGTKTYSGNVTINGSGTWNETAAAVVSFGGNLQNDGTLTAGSGTHTFSGTGKSFAGTSPISIPNIAISGTYTNNVTLTVSTALSGAGSLTQGMDVTLNLGASTANFTLSSLDASVAGNTVNYNGAAQTVKAITYHHLTLGGSGVKTLTGLTTVSGNLTFSGTTISATTTNALQIGGDLTLNGTGTNSVTTGASLSIDGNLNINATGANTFTVGAAPFTVTGTTTIAGSSSSVNSTLIHTSGATPTYIGLVTISPNGIWNNSGNVNVNLRGGLMNNSAKPFSAGSGVYTFNTNIQDIGGTNAISIPNITITTVNLNNQGTLTVGNALSGSGGLIQADGATLNIGGTSGIAVLMASATDNTVNYTGAAQTVIATPYFHLTLSGSGIKTLPSGLTDVNGNLTLSGTASATSADDLTVDGALTIGTGTAFTVGAFDITVTGPTTVNGTGSITHSSATGSKTYTGDVTINAGSTWFDLAAVIPISFGGNLQNNGNFVAGQGVHTFTGANKTFGGTISIPNITISGSYTNNSTLTASSALEGAGSLTQGAGASLNIGGTSGITSLTANASPNTVFYSMSSSQTVRGITYHHLTIGGGFSTTKTLGGAVTVNGILTINASTTLDVSGSDYGLTVRGNWVNSGTFTPQAGTVTLQGSAVQSMSGASTFYNLIIDNNAGVTLSSNNPTVNGILTLTSGKITTGTRSLIIGTAGSVTGASSTRYVNGNLQKIFATGPQSFIFAIGDATNYTPLTLAFANVSTTGNVTARSNSGEHLYIATSGLDSTKDVNRNWSLTSSGGLVFTTYDATFTFVNGVPVDLDTGANTSNFYVKRNINSTTWAATTTGTRTSTSTQATGIIAMGGFAIGEPDIAAPTVTNVSSTKLDGAYTTGVSIPVTVTFNELVVVTGTPTLTLETGTTNRIVNFSGGNRTNTLTFNYIVQAGDTSADLDYVASNSLALNGGTIRDYASNNATLTLPAPGAAGSLGANKNIVIDTTGPTVAMSSTATDPTNASPIVVTVTFNESVTGFTSSDISAGNGTVSGFTGSGASYSFDLTPSANGLVTADIAASAAQDLAGNNNTAAAQFSRTYDGTAPGVTMNSTATDPTNVSPIVVTVTFSESVTGFTSSDISAGNGTVSGFTGSGASYSFNLTPVADGLVTANIAAGAAQDLAGNNNTAATQFSRTYDGTAPSVSMSSTATNPTNASPIVVTVTFNESVTGFTSSDISAGNGTVSGFTGSGASYSFNLTPSANGLVTANIAAGVAKDATGNNNTSATQFSRTYDGSAPTVTMSSTATNPTSVSPIPATAQFSENVTGFTVGDIVPGNATIGSFVAVDGDTYTFTLTPSGQGLVTANIGAGAGQDLAGNNNTAAAQFSRTFDGTAPSVTMSSTATNPTNASPIAVTVTFSESVTGFTSSDISAGNGTVSGFTGSGASYSFNLTPSANGLVTANIAAGVAQDLAGNNNTAATQFSRTFDSIAPTVTMSSTATNPTSVSPIVVTVTFSESVTGFTSSDISAGNGTVSGFTGSGASYSFNLTPSANGLVTANIAASTAQDLAGNNNTAATQFSRTFNGVAQTYRLYLPLITRP